jgi:anthranilate synthase/aminodeoxychorismate synthase-like glutamine amidotransferase
MTASILVIDNYDSFTYNLVQYLGELGANITVRRNDALTVDDIAELNPDGLVLSPGPGHPESAGITLDTIRRYAGTIPILGVCLGHQAIGAAFGGEVVRAERIMHGKTSPVDHEGDGLFDGLPAPFQAGRYHSLVVKRETMPQCLEVTAWTDTGEVMGLKHKEMPVYGVQFHPESILTEGGKRLLQNFLSSL